MGANWFQTQSKGKTAQDAYNRAVERADDEYGHQEGYSGHINSTSGFRDVTKEWKNSKKSMSQYMDDLIDKLTKHQGAQAICLEEPKSNSNKIKTQVEHIVKPGTKKWILMYVVYEGSARLNGFATKAEAVTYARKYSETTQLTTMVKMEKQLNKKDDSLVAKIKYKASSDEKEGRWVFFGWASE